MKKTLICLVLLLSGCATIPKDSPENRRALATLVVDTQQPERQLKDMREQMKRAMSQNVAQAPGAARTAADVRQRMDAMMDRMWTVLDKYLTAEKVRGAMIDAYSATFTTEELAGLQQFYTSDAGKALVAKQPELMKRILEATQTMMKDVLPEIQRVAREETMAVPQEKTEPKATTPPAPAASVSEASRKMADEMYPDVQARYEQAQELARQGKNAEALAEYLWCYDDGMRRSPRFVGVRLSFLLSSVVKMGLHYPPALQALQERRDAAQARLLTDPNDASAQMDFGALNRELGDNAANLAFFDQLPADSRARGTFGRLVFDQLVEAKRYPEAAAAQPYDQFKRTFNLTLEHLQTHPEQRAAMSSYVIQSGGKELEVLAGAGDLDHARELLQLLLKTDNSEAAMSTLRKYLDRAGHTELLEEKAPRSSP